MTTTFPEKSPLDGSPLPPLAETDVATLPDIVTRARRAHTEWNDLAVSGRVRRLSKLRNKILSSASSIAELVHREVGKPEVEVLLGEVLGSADVVDYWCGVIEELLEPEELDLDAISYPGKEGVIHREGRGVVAVIMPWNFPFALPLRTIVPALLAGNAVVFKPSEVAARTGALLGSLLSDLVPDGLFTVVQGGGDVGAALCTSGVDVVVFTGSVPTGKKIAHACAEALIPCSLELGGKDAAIVLADAKLERTASGIVWGALLNAGQNCASIERVYVEKSIASALGAKIREIVQGLRVPEDVGPLTTQAQHATVARHVAQAKDKGASVLAGGAQLEGTKFQPTVLEVRDDSLEVCTEETFGPVIVLRTVESVDEAISLANASRYGLTASIWSKNTRKARKLAPRLRAGVVTINNHSFTGAIPAAPWSGFGDTGYGITGSPLALDTLTRPRFILVDGAGQKELYWFPYSDNLRKVALSLVRVRDGSAGVFSRLFALFGLVGAMLRRLAEKPAKALPPAAPPPPR